MPLNSSVPCVLLLLAVLAGCEPADRTPGTWLSGTQMDSPISDWSFLDREQEIFVQTDTWYLIPHSVTVVGAAAGGRVYVPSIYSEDLPFPGTKRWNKNLQAQPLATLRIGERLIRMRGTPVTGEEFNAGLAALAAKYPFWSEARQDAAKVPHFAIIRFEQVEQ